MYQHISSRHSSSGREKATYSGYDFYFIRKFIYSARNIFILRLSAILLRAHNRISVRKSPFSLCLYVNVCVVCYSLLCYLSLRTYVKKLTYTLTQIPSDKRTIALSRYSLAVRSFWIRCCAVLTIWQYMWKYRRKKKTK